MKHLTFLLLVLFVTSSSCVSQTKETKIQQLIAKINFYKNEITQLREHSEEWSCTLVNSNDGVFSFGKGHTEDEAQSNVKSACLIPQEGSAPKGARSQADCNGTSLCTNTPFTEQDAKERIIVFQAIILGAEAEIALLSKKPQWKCTFTAPHNKASYDGKGLTSDEAIHNAQQNCFANPNAKSPIRFDTCNYVGGTFECEHIESQT